MSSKYAIFKQGSKQYRVEEGEVLDVDLLQAELGASVEFPDVLFAHDGKSAHVGKPTVKGYKVKCEVIGEAKGPKLPHLNINQATHSAVNLAIANTTHALKW